MSIKKLPIVTLYLDKIISGGQALGTLADGRKAMVWGGLPGETVRVQVTRKKSSYVEGYVAEVMTASDARLAPRDPDSFLSTSPWQIMNFETEQHYKAALIEEAFELHDLVLPHPIEVFTDNKLYEYRNKIEYSFWFDHHSQQLALAFFRRGTHGKIPVLGTSLAQPAINSLAQKIVQTLNAQKIDGRQLKTLLIRCDRTGNTAWQLYVKDRDFQCAALLSMLTEPTVIRGEVIYSDPRSPASVVTEVLASSADDRLLDTVLGVPFRYATEGFFQINLPVYEQALQDMRHHVPPQCAVVDMYSGVGTIGLTIGGSNVTMVESSEAAVREMTRNITALKRSRQVRAVLARSEQSLEYITKDTTLIVDPARAGLHDAVIGRLLEVKPPHIIYLSCNPVTQARDVAKLMTAYGIRAHKGYNFFPRTPHIEHLIVLENY